MKTRKVDPENQLPHALRMDSDDAELWREAHDTLRLRISEAVDLLRDLNVVGAVEVLAGALEAGE